MSFLISEKSFRSIHILFHWKKYVPFLSLCIMFTACCVYIMQYCNLHIMFSESVFKYKISECLYLLLSTGWIVSTHFVFTWMQRWGFFFCLNMWGCFKFEYEAPNQMTVNQTMRSQTKACITKLSCQICALDNSIQLNGNWNNGWYLMCIKFGRWWIQIWAKRSAILVHHCASVNFLATASLRYDLNVMRISSLSLCYITCNLLHSPNSLII